MQTPSTVKYNQPDENTLVVMTNVSAESCRKDARRFRRLLNSKKKNKDVLWLQYQAWKYEATAYLIDRDGITPDSLSLIFGPNN